MTTSEWTIERLDALPDGTVIEANVTEVERFVRDGRWWVEVGHRIRWSSHDLVGNQATYPNQPEHLTIRVVSVPVEALLGDEALWAPGRVGGGDPYELVAAAVAHATGGAS